MGSSQTRDQTRVSCIGRWILNQWTTRKALSSGWFETPALPKMLEGISSIQFSRSVMSNPLQPHESQHARPPCPSQTPWVYSNSCPASLWCHPAISSSVIPFSSCPQSLPASGSFPVSQLFAWGGQSIGVSEGMGWKDLCDIGNQPGSGGGGRRDTFKTFKMFGHYFPRSWRRNI